MSLELEPTNQQEEAEVAFGIELRIKSAMARGRQALWDLAEALYEFDEEHGWLKLGHEKLSDWLAEPDVTLTLGTYRRYVRTWRKLVVEKQIDASRVRELEQSKVAIVVDKVANNEVLVEDAFADVEALGASDLRAKYYNRRENPATSEPETSGQVLPDEDEPTRADEYQPSPEEYEPDVSDAAIEASEGNLLEAEAREAVLHGEVLDAEIVDDYDWPAWMTEGQVHGLLQDVREGVDCGAQFPRIKRRSAEVAVELAQAWLARHQS